MRRAVARRRRGCFFFLLALFHAFFREREREKERVGDCCAPLHIAARARPRDFFLSLSLFLSLALVRENLENYAFNMCHTSARLFIIFNRRSPLRANSFAGYNARSGSPPPRSRLLLNGFIYALV